MDLTAASAYLSAHDRFILTAHETPDGDALGSEYALYRALTDLGKQVYIFNADPPPHKFAFVDEEDAIQTLTDKRQLPEDLSSCVLVILDTNDVNNIGIVADMLLDEVQDCLMIDHHEVEPGATIPNLLDFDVSSTCEILYSLFKEMEVDISYPIAQALYMGILYDTGSFAYSRTTARTFQIAHDLVSAGVDPHGVYSVVYESNSVSSIVLQARVLATLELRFDQHVALMRMLKETVEDCGASYEEGQNLINIPLKSERIRVIIFFKENLDGVLRCSLRSKGEVNVAQIAQSFGGGGHRAAAGFKCRDPLDVVERKLLDILEPYFGNEDQS
jgi:bifunctional oligoribonuclease and PAP phosphatase NrnA